MAGAILVGFGAAVDCFDIAGRDYVLEQANPIYRAGTGKRRGGGDQFFDSPESAPEGTRRFQGDFRLTRAAARSEGKRLVLSFEGLRMGIFAGSVQYLPGGSLVQQRALVSTSTNGPCRARL